MSIAIVNLNTLSDNCPQALFADKEKEEKHVYC